MGYYRNYCFISYWLFIWSVIWYILSKFNLTIPNPYPLYYMSFIPNVVDLLFEFYKLYIHFKNVASLLTVILVKILYHFVPFLYISRNLKVINNVYSIFILCLIVLVYKKLKICDFDKIYSRDHLDDIHNIDIKKYIKMRYDIDI